MKMKHTKTRTTTIRLLTLCLLLTGAVFAGCGDEPFDIELRDGELEVRIVTTGTNLDSDGYRVEIDTRPDLDEDVDVNDVVVIDIFPVGTYTVELRDVASNCDVDDDDQQVELDDDRRTFVTFNVVCS